MRNDLPTRGAYPRKILRRPRRSRRSSACTRRSNSSGSSLRSERGVTVTRLILRGGGGKWARKSLPNGRGSDRSDSFFQRSGGVQGQVQLQDVAAGFTKAPQLAVLGIGGYQLAEGVGGDAAGGGDAGHLQERADVMEKTPF